MEFLHIALALLLLAQLAFDLVFAYVLVKIISPKIGEVVSRHDVYDEFIRTFTSALLARSIRTEQADEVERGSDVPVLSTD